MAKRGPILHIPMCGDETCERCDKARVDLRCRHCGSKASWREWPPAPWPARFNLTCLNTEQCKRRQRAKQNT